MAKLRDESAKEFFSLSTDQFINGVIEKDEYRERLSVLKTIVKRNSALYQELCLLQTIGDDELVKNLSSSAAIFSEGPQLSSPEQLLILVNLRINDPDPFLSNPHLHLEDGEKMNIFTGKRSDGKYCHKNDLVKLWNNPAVLSKLKKHHAQLASKGNTSSNLN